MTPQTAIAPLLDEQICFALYSASRAFTSRYRELLEPLGLTYPQYLAMLVLWESEPLSVSHLGERLQLDSGTLSPLLKRLESVGLITRTRATDDERSVLVALTQTGDALRAKAVDIPYQLCASTGLTPADLGRLQAELSSLTATMRHAT
ncbi:MAG TPA: MarR family transcriptional regulator [Galbitalea sp.]|jgi:DNA-binding MarR family transcriptional regulator